MEIKETIRKTLNSLYRSCWISTSISFFAYIAKGGGKTNGIILGFLIIWVVLFVILWVLDMEKLKVDPINSYRK